MDIKKYIADDSVQARIKENLRDKSQGFVVSLLSLVNSNKDLAECEPATVLNAAMTAASLDLPINQNLGFAYIIPYKGRAQFQMGYKGFIQLAQRSGQFKTINVTDVREGEITSTNRLTGEIIFDWAEDRENLKVIGYVGYIELTNGFKKSLYMTTEQMRGHGKKFSQSAKKGYGLWVDEFDTMAYKTVIKMLLSKYAPLSIEMQEAVQADQSIINGDNYEYVDNQPILPEEIAEDKEREKILAHIESAKTLDELLVCTDYINSQTRDAYDAKLKILSENDGKSNKKSST